jgi:putative FmdB family regulatory protein
MARVAAYVRRSSEGEEAKNTSLETQEEHVREWANKEQHQCVVTFSDPGGKSYSLDRPALNDLFQAARRHEFDIVAVWRYDRFSRDEEQAIVAVHMLRECGVKVVSTTQPLPDGPLGTVMLAMHNFASTQELSGIRVRIADGKRKRIQSGKLPGAGIPKYGYRFAGEKKERYELDPETAPVVTRIFNEFQRGQTIRGIATLLTAEGVPTPTMSMARAGVRYRKGMTVTTWRPSTLHKILTTRSYTGKHEGNVTLREAVQVPDPVTGEPRTISRRVPRSWESGERVTYGADVCPPIISEELFEEVRTKLHENKERSPRNTKHPDKALLRAGIAVCGYCGRPLVASWRKKGEYYRYICQARHALKDTCPAPREFSVDACELDKLVWDRFVTTITSPEMMNKLYEAYSANIDKFSGGIDNTLAGLESALAEAQSQEASYLDAVGSLPVGHSLRVEYLKRAEDAHEKVLSRTAARDEVHARHLAAAQQRSAFRSIMEAASAPGLAEYMNRVTPESKRQVLYSASVRVQVWGKEHDPQAHMTVFSESDSESMPTYQYLCESCGHRFDIFQHFADTPLTTCPNCSGPIHRVLFPAGIVFKGSGFYKTDSRGSSAAAEPAPAAQTSDGATASSNGTEKAAAKTESASESKTASKPTSDAAPASSASTGS